MKYIYPYIENADEILYRLCLEGIKKKYDGYLKRRAFEQLEKELDIVNKQESASGFLILLNALKMVGADSKDFVLLGCAASSLINYSIGITAIEPLTCEPRVYSEFYYGIEGEKYPVFEMRVNKDLNDKLTYYFKGYTGPGVIKKSQNMSGVGCGEKVYIVDESKDYSQDLKDVFYISFMLIENEEELKSNLLNDDVINTCKPTLMEDYVKCYGFKHSTGAWEDNAERLINAWYVRFDQLIANREDVYEYLINKGVPSNRAYEIAEYVRMGKVHRYGWTKEMLDILEAAKIDSWFKESCEKIMYLFPRAHAMSIYKWLGIIG